MATWDRQKGKWKASIGTGAERTFLYAQKRLGEQGLPGEAGQLEADQLKRAKLLGPPPCRPGSVSEFVQEVWWHQERAFETNRKYRERFTAHIEPAIGTKLLTEVTFEDMQLLVDKCKVGCKPKTARNRFEVAQSIFALAKRLRRIKENPCKDVLLPKLVRRKARRELNVDLGKKIDEICIGTDCEGPAWTAQRLALRRNETCGLRPGDVTLFEDWAIVRIAINRQVSETKEQLKNKIEGEFREMVVDVEWGKKILSYHSGMSPFIFCDGSGKPIHPETLGKKFSRLMKGAGVKITFKELRNMGISNMLRAGVPLATVADQVGHCAISMTMQYKDIDGKESLDAFNLLKSAYESKANT
jgi:integrase